MTELPTATRRRLASSVRLLASDREGEVLAAAHAIPRTLKAAGIDIHALAELIEQANGGKLNDAEMKKLYDAGHAAGYAAGVCAAEAKVAHDDDGFRNINGTPSWQQIVRFCQQRRKRLRGNEQGFVDDMAGQILWREPTPKQAKWSQSIYARLGGPR